MKRTTIFADEQTLHLLHCIARAEGVSLAEIVRRALAAFVGQQRPSPSFVGIGESGRSDIAERAEEILHEGFGR